MTQPAPITPRRRPARTMARGFTLVELIVVIGIIALLIGILLPAISSLLGRSQDQITRAALNSISTALETYKSDYGDYPRFLQGTNDASYSGSDRGARLLARALIGVAPKNDIAAARGFMDGYGTPEDPFGWQERRQNTGSTNRTDDDIIQGNIQQPYLDPANFNIRSTPIGGLTYGPDAVILDGNNMPILYYPRRPGNVIVTNPEALATNTPIGVTQILGQPIAYNPGDNSMLGQTTLRVLLGDRNGNGSIDGSEQVTTTAPFLLIATDSSGTYGTDVITHFGEGTGN